jgi:hypothetical protein
LKSKDDELPQHNSMFSAVGSDELLRRASEILDYDPDISRKSKKMSMFEIEKRDFLFEALFFSRKMLGI